MGTEDDREEEFGCSWWSIVKAYGWERFKLLNMDEWSK